MIEEAETSKQVANLQTDVSAIYLETLLQRLLIFFYWVLYMEHKTA